MANAKNHKRLARNFHKTFKPERQYIAAMLRYAASGQEGDYGAIAAATGIPTGTSSGKVPAIIDYCRGMGLIVLAGKQRTAVKRPELTAFGRIVLIEDPYLTMAVSQWIAHLNLCGPLTGADVWYNVFMPGTQSLGMSFSREKLESYLSLAYGVGRSGLIGPLIGTYADEAALGLCGALCEEAGVVMRKGAPISDEFGRAYGAWLSELVARHCGDAGQVSAPDLDARSGWRTIPGWDITDVQRVLELVERKGLLEVDRHMEPWLLRPTAPSDVWHRIYDDLL